MLHPPEIVCHGELIQPCRELTVYLGSFRNWSGSLNARTNMRQCTHWSSSIGGFAPARACSCVS
jgi:hypothetical protein